MVELLIIFAMFGWLLVTIAQFLSSLAAFPTICVAAVLVPAFGVIGANRLLRAMDLEFLLSRRAFLPPERFYWPRKAKLLWRAFLIATALAVVSWSCALFAPARPAVDLISILGWISGAAAVISSAAAAAVLWVFFRGSQRYDRLTPSLVGAARRFMFWLSDNYEFLGEEPEKPKTPRKRAFY